MRIMYHGFIGLCEQFLTTYASDGYFISPIRINGSAVESYFSQLKYAARGQLSSTQYASVRGSVATSKAASTKRPRERDYRDAGLDIQPVQLTKRKKSTRKATLNE